MHQRLRIAIALFVFFMITTAGYVWHYAGNNFAVEQIAISYFLVGMVGLSGVWLGGEVIVMICTKYQDLSEEEKRKVRVVADDCKSAYQGQNSWWDMICRCM